MVSIAPSAWHRRPAKVRRRCSPRRLLGRQTTRIFQFLWVRNACGLRPSTDFEGCRACFPGFSPKPDENCQNPAIFGSRQPRFYQGTSSRSKRYNGRIRYITRSGHRSSYSERQNRVSAASDVWNPHSGPFFGIARKALTDALEFTLAILPQQGENRGLHQHSGKDESVDEPTEHHTPSKPR